MRFDSKMSMTPLWVIAIFVSLTEVGLTVTVTQATGWVQGALTAFVILFPTAVAAAFFVIIWCRPENLYSPTEFGGASVNDYVRAMRVRSDSQEKAIEILKELIGVSGSTIPSQSDFSTASTPLGPARDRVEHVQPLIIDTGPLLSPGKARRMTRYYDHDQVVVQELLNDIWFELSSHSKIPAYTYGRTWVLVNTRNGEQLSDLKSNVNDTLEEAGITPGMSLSVAQPAQ